MKYKFLILTILIPFLSISQTIKGVIYDKDSDQNLSYVNIGIIGGNIGTVSDEEGYFTLDIPEKK